MLLPLITKVLFILAAVQVFRCYFNYARMEGLTCQLFKFKDNYFSTDRKAKNCPATLANEVASH